jgi:hypothetical protein
MQPNKSAMIYLPLVQDRMLYSTQQTAKKLGIDVRSLNRYIAAKKIRAPELSRVGGVKVRLWSDRDIERVRQLLPKIANGRKTRYQKKRKQAKKDKQ